MPNKWSLIVRANYKEHAWPFFGPQVAAANEAQILQPVILDGFVNVDFYRDTNWTPLDNKTTTHLSVFYSYCFSKSKWIPQRMLILKTIVSVLMVQ